VYFPLLLELITAYTANPIAVKFNRIRAVASKIIDWFEHLKSFFSDFDVLLRKNGHFFYHKDKKLLKKLIRRLKL